LRGLSARQVVRPPVLWSGAVGTFLVVCRVPLVPLIGPENCFWSFSEAVDVSAIDVVVASREDVDPVEMVENFGLFSVQDVDHTAECTLVNPFLKISETAELSSSKVLDASRYALFSWASSNGQ
jgi:hypothetical protein